MKPYYSDNLVTIYHGDARDLVTQLQAEVAITDPPYGLQAIAGTYGRHGDTIAGDLDTSVRDAFLELWSTRPLLMFSSARLPEPPGDWDYRLVWDKVEPGLNGGAWRYTHEPIYVRGNGWVRSAHAFSILRFAIQNGTQERRSHPHRKPVPLMRALVASAPTGTIIDPFMGSGTTLRACKDLGRRAIGIDVDEAHCDSASRRCSQESLWPAA